MNILPGEKISVGRLLVLGVLLAMLLITVVWTTSAWMLTGNVQVPARAWVGFTLEVLIAVVCGCGLMALMFYSSRSGHDDLAAPTVRKSEFPPVRKD